MQIRSPEFRVDWTKKSPAEAGPKREHRNMCMLLTRSHTGSRRSRRPRGRVGRARDPGALEENSIPLDNDGGRQWLAPHIWQQSWPIPRPMRRARPGRHVGTSCKAPLDHVQERLFRPRHKLAASVLAATVGCRPSWRQLACAPEQRAWSRYQVWHRSLPASLRRSHRDSICVRNGLPGWGGRSRTTASRMMQYGR